MSAETLSLTVLYADERSRLERHLVRRGLSAPAAADAVQEAFLRLLGAPDRAIANQGAYLRRTAERIAIDAWRRQSRLATVMEPHAPEADVVSDPGAQPDAAMIASEERRALEEAVAALPPRCREVLMLHKFEELSYAEIAERLGITRNTVMVHLANAMTALRRRLRAAERGV